MINAKDDKMGDFKKCKEPREYTNVHNTDGV